MHREENVLVIDDELFSREYFQKILEKDGNKVKAVSTGLEGMDAFRESTFDLVVLDIRLPDANGIDILRQMREINWLTPVIIVTAYGTVENAVQAMKLGAFDFLLKPFEETEKVLITVKNAIYQGKLEKENLSLKNQLKSESLFQNIIGKSEIMQRDLRVDQKSFRSRK